MSRFFVSFMTVAGIVFSIVFITGSDSFGTHTDPNVIHACVNKRDGEVSIVSNPSKCKQRLETPIDLQKAGALESAVAALQAQVAALQTTINNLQSDLDAAEATIAVLQSDLAAVQSNNALALDPYVSVDMNGINDLDGPHVIFTGVNVHIRNGSNITDSSNGLGNLLIGYNEQIPMMVGPPATRTGSHNLIVGFFHGYSSFGGLVAGSRNTISGPSASVTGGFNNVASGNTSSVSGGSENEASDFDASVSGGINNTASENEASVSGGNNNTASGFASSVSGGINNEASNFQASVSGGIGNTASGNSATVSGGNGLTADDPAEHLP